MAPSRKKYEAEIFGDRSCGLFVDPERRRQGRKCLHDSPKAFDRRNGGGHILTASLHDRRQGDYRRSGRFVYDQGRHTKEQRALVESLVFAALSFRFALLGAGSWDALSEKVREAGSDLSALLRAL